MISAILVKIKWTNAQEAVAAKYCCCWHAITENEQYRPEAETGFNENI